VKEEKEQFDQLAGEYGRKYNLTDRQQTQLRAWLEEKASENAAKFTAVLENDNSNFFDLMMASREAERSTDGIERFMERQLRGQPLADFKADRLLERIESVEGEANGRLNRLDNIVELDAAQENELFYLMARSSEDYIPSMDIEGMTGSRTPLDHGGRNQAIGTFLRPEQVELLNTHRQNRRAEAEREMLDVGIRLPPNWHLFVDDDDW